jgi:hypothetical protein
MGVTAGIFLASILLKEMRYLVYIRYLWNMPVIIDALNIYVNEGAIMSAASFNNLFGIPSCLIDFVVLTSERSFFKPLV